MKKTILVFASLAIALLALFQISKYNLLTGNTRIELVIAITAVLFLVLGIYLHKKSLSKDSKSTTQIDHNKIAELGISKREYEVLVKVSKGFSNKEIADQLFVSESTIKTHVSNILVKLDAKRRTQAIQKAKELAILPS